MDKDQYLQHGIWLGFPTGRSPAGDLATAAIHLVVGNDGDDLRFTRIGKERERSYFTHAFNEANVRRCMRLLTDLGFDAQGHQHRTISIGGEHVNWTLHVSLGEMAITKANAWKAKKLDLEGLISQQA